VETKCPRGGTLKMLGAAVGHKVIALQPTLILVSIETSEPNFGFPQD